MGEAREATQTSSPEPMLAQYADGPAQLEGAIAGLAEAGLDAASSADSWSIRQIVHHVADGDDIWKTCIKMALGNSQGVFNLLWYWAMPQNAWAEKWNYAGRAIEPSLALFRANRCHVVQLMQQIPEAWEGHALLKQRDGQETEITVGEVIENQVRHVVQHVNDIRAIRQAHHI